MLWATQKLEIDLRANWDAEGFRNGYVLRRLSVERGNRLAEFSNVRLGAFEYVPVDYPTPHYRAGLFERSADEIFCSYAIEPRIEGALGAYYRGVEFVSRFPLSKHIVVYRPRIRTSCKLHDDTLCWSAPCVLPRRIKAEALGNFGIGSTLYAARDVDVSEGDRRQLELPANDN